MASSTKQTLALTTVYDYEYGPDGNPLIGKRVKLTLTTEAGVTIAPQPTVNLEQQPVLAATTDSNGFWQVAVVANNRITPSNSLYATTVEGHRSFQITVSDVNVPAAGWQSSAIIVNTPASLTPAGQTVGNLTVSGTLSVTGALSVGGLTDTGPLTAASAAVTGDLTESGRLIFTPATGKILGGATALSLRNNADTADNLLLTDAGLATVRAGLVVTAGGLTVSAGGAAITGPLHVTTTSALDGDVTAGGRLVLSTATSKIVPGATALQLRNNADSATNLQLGDGGLATLRNALSVPPVAGGTVATTNYGTMPIKSEEQTVSGSVAATITLPASGSFPTGFRHMKIRVRARGDAGVAIVNMGIRFNGDNGANYDGQVITANGTGANPTNVNATATTPPICSDAPGNTATANDWSDVIIEIRDYNAAIRQCAHIRSTVHDIDSNAGTFFRVGTQTWRTAGALTSIVLALSSGNFAIGTEVTTYLEP